MGNVGKLTIPKGFWMVQASVKPSPCTTHSFPSCFLMTWGGVKIYFMQFFFLLSALRAKRALRAPHMSKTHRCVNTHPRTPPHDRHWACTTHTRTYAHTQAMLGGFSHIFPYIIGEAYKPSRYITYRYRYIYIVSTNAHIPCAKITPCSGSKLPLLVFIYIPF